MLHHTNFRHGDLATWICALLNEAILTQFVGVTWMLVFFLIYHTGCVMLEVLPALRVSSGYDTECLSLA